MFTQADLNSSAVRYVHDGGETTSDGFSFSLSDGALTVTGTFAITVTPLNDLPVIIVNTGLTVNEGGTRVLTNTKLAATDPDNTATQLVYTVSTLPAQGRLERVVSPGVAITTFIQADLNSRAVRYVHDGGDSIVDAFHFTVSDGFASLSNTFAITVTPVNDPPVLTTSNITISEGQLVVLSTANLNASDADSGSLVFTVSGVTHGLFNDLITGSSVSSFTRAQVQAGQIEFVHDGSENAPSAAVSVSDSVASTPATAISFVFNNVNDPPVLAPATFLIPENATTGHLVGQVVWNDPDAGESHSFSILPGPSSSLFSINALTGAISVADGSGLDYEVATSHDLQVQVADQSGASSQATIQIVIQNVNEVPVVLGFPSVNSTEDGPVLTLDLTTGFNDPESAQLSYQIVAMTNPSLFSSAQINAPGVLELTGTPNAHGACFITVRATDPFGLSATTTIEVVITAVNDRPVANADAWAAPIATSVVISPSTLLANDADVDHDPLVVSMTRLPDHGSLVTNLDGTFTYTPETGYSGADGFEYVVSDGTTSSAAATVSLTVSAVGPGTAFISNSPTNTSNSSSSNPTDGSEDSISITDPSNGTTSYSTTATASGSPEGSSSGGSFAEVHSSPDDNELLSVMPKSHDEDGLGLFLTRQRASVDEVTSRGRSPLGLDLARRRTGSGGEASGALAFAESTGLSTQFVFPTSQSMTQLRAILTSTANQSAFAEVTKSLQSGLTHDLVFEVPALAGASLTVGYVVWMLRGGLLISSLLAQMPMWSIVDPLTVLDSLDQSDEDDESIGSLVEQGQSELEPAL